MPYHEVFIDRDARAPLDLSRQAVFMRHRLQRLFSATVLATMDVGAVLASVYVAFALINRFTDVVLVVPGFAHIAAVCILVVVVFSLFGMYGRLRRRHGAGRVVRAYLLTAVVAAIWAVAIGDAGQRLYLATAWAFAVLMTLVLRSVYDVALARLYPQGDVVPLILVGRPAYVERTLGLLAFAPPKSRYRVLGVVGDEPFPDDWSEHHEGLGQLGLTANLEAIVRRERPAELLVGDPDLVRDSIPELTEICRRHHVVLKLAAIDLDFGHSRVCYLPEFGAPLFAIRPAALAGFDYYIKRAVDLGGALTGLVLLSPILAAIAVAIRATSPGPALFVAPRIGVGQRPFRCYKFRTMREDAPELQAELEGKNEADGAIFKITDDPRITNVGRFLRRTSLDELPQLWNVLRGEMSLVGPRPLPLRDFRLLDDIHKQRHVVLPGMTGLWQVCGRSDASFDEMIALDLRYIETWSLGLDLSILLRTLGAVANSRGAC